MNRLVAWAAVTTVLGLVLTTGCGSIQTAENPQASPSAAELSRGELAYLERIVQANESLSRARVLADKYAKSPHSDKGRDYLKQARGMFGDLTHEWNAESVVGPSARLREIESQWLLALLYTGQSVSYLTEAVERGYKSVTAGRTIQEVVAAMSPSEAKAALAVQDKGWRLRRRSYAAQARVITAVRRLSAGVSVPGLMADLVADPYSFGNDSRTKYRKTLWREFASIAYGSNIDKLDLKRMKELTGAFDEILDRRWTEYKIENDWRAAPWQEWRE